jgi:hypothetical protein
LPVMNMEIYYIFFFVIFCSFLILSDCCDNVNEHERTN